ncbi:MAG: hypothetical protein IJB80_04520 [Clostridia bacterium]|nr:hypothetical protein [Clostridia bacterium]
MKKILTFVLIVSIAVSTVFTGYAKTYESNNVIYNLDFENYDRSIYSKTGWDKVQGSSYTTYPGENASDGSTCFTMRTSGVCHGLFNPEEYIPGKGIYRLSFDVLRHGKKGIFYLRFGNSDCTAMNNANSGNMFETFLMNETTASYFNGTKGWGINAGGVEYDEDVWYNVDIWFDFDNASVYYYMDDKLLGKDAINASFKDIRWVWFRYETTDFAQYISLDNVKFEKIDPEYAEALYEQGVAVPDYMMFPVKVGIASQNSGNIFRKEEIPTFAISYSNQLDTEITFNATYDVYTRKGEHCLTTGRDITLKAGETLEETLEIAVDNFDIYTLKARYTNLSNGAVSEKETIQFSWVNSPTPGVKNNKYGFGALMGHGTKSQPEKLTPIIDIVGTGIQRDAGFGYTRNESGEFVLGTEGIYAKLEQFSKESGVKFMVQVGGGTIPPKDEAGLKELEDAMAHFAARYKDSIAYWQYLNEPDFKRTDEMSCADYARGLEYFYRGVKRGNPDALVLGCTVTRANVEWIEAVIDAGGGEHMDVVAIHPYQGQASPEGARWSEWVMRVKEMLNRRKYGHLEVWVTEGNATCSKEYNTQLQHGYNLIRHYATIERTKCVDKFFHFSLQSEATDPNNNEHWYGIINGWNADNAYGAQPEFLMACNYFQQTESAEYLDSIVEDNRYIIRYKNADGSNLLIMYSDYDSKQVALKLGADRGILTDVYGNGVEVKGQDGIFTFTLSDAPIYFTYTGSDFAIHDGGIAVDAVNQELTVGSSACYTLYGCADKEISLDHSSSLSVQVGTSGNDAIIEVTAEEIPEVFDLDMICNEYGTKIYRDNINVTIKDGDAVESYLQLGVDYVKKAADISLEVKPFNDNTTKYWKMIATVTNNQAQESISGKIDFLTPAVFADKFEPVSVKDLKPGESKVLTFNIPAKDTGTYTSYTGTFTLTTGEVIEFALGDHPRSFRYREPVKLNIRYIKKRKSEITIDGNVDKEEWQQYKVYSFGKDDISYGSTGSAIFGVIEEATQGSVEDYGGNADFSGDMYAQWDDQYLYVAAVVKDDYHYAKEAPTRFYLDDVFSVYTQPTRTQRHETRMDMALSEFMDMEPVLFCNWTEIVGQLAVGVIYQEEDGAKVDIKRENGMTVYEARIPAELVSERPFQKYLNIFVNLYLRDYDVQTDKNASWNGWTCLVE